MKIASLITALPNKSNSGYDNVNNVLLKQIKDCQTPNHHNKQIILWRKVPTYNEIGRYVSPVQIQR